MKTELKNLLRFVTMYTGASLILTSLYFFATYGVLSAINFNPGGHGAEIGFLIMMSLGSLLAGVLTAIPAALFLSKGIE